jgi:hypothetical protein
VKDIKNVNSDPLLFVAIAAIKELAQKVAQLELARV